MARTRDFRLEYRKRKARAIVRTQEAKRGKPLSESYRKRIERSIIRTGGTLQRARGHKPREHIERAERERSTEGLTKAQQKTIFWWAVRRSFVVHDDVSDPEEVVEHAKEAGYEWFKQYRKRWEQERRDYLRRGRRYDPGRHFSLEDFGEEVKVPDMNWLYYH